MKLNTVELSELTDLAILAATEAGKMVVQSRPHDIQRKTAGASLASQVVTEIDRRSEEIILGILESSIERFDFGLLTEERDDDASRLSADYFWSIDPLDGTLSFIEGSPGYAVSIALVDRNGIPWIGVIYDPVETTTVHAIRGVGAFRDGDRWRIEPPGDSEVLSVFVDRSFLTSNDRHAVIEALNEIAQDMGLTAIQLQATSGAVMNACGVLAHPSACYFKYPKPTGGGSVWDFAATACVFDEVGAVATDIHGARLDLNRKDSLFMNHRGVLFATDEALAQRIRAIHSAAG